MFDFINECLVALVVTICVCFDVFRACDALHHAVVICFLRDWVNHMNEPTFLNVDNNQFYYNIIYVSDIQS